MFYVIYVNGLDEDISPEQLSNEDFIQLAQKQNNVFSREDLVKSWNEDTLPVIDSYIRWVK